MSPMRQRRATPSELAVACLVGLLLLTAGKDTKPGVAQISYLAHGLSWAPSYRVDLTDPKNLNLLERKALLDRLATRRLPDGWTGKLPSFPADAKGMATRKASGAILTAIAIFLVFASVVVVLWVGAQDVLAFTGSGDTGMRLRSLPNIIRDSVRLTEGGN